MQSSLATRTATAEDKGRQGKGGREMRGREEEEPISQRFNSKSELKVKLGCYARATKEIKFSRKGFHDRGKRELG